MNESKCREQCLCGTIRALVARGSLRESQAVQPFSAWHQLLGPKRNPAANWLNSEILPTSELGRSIVFGGLAKVISRPELGMAAELPK
jgi:hypothetical protein